VTTDEELDFLAEQLRRLKIEYEIFFNNAAKRPPTDIEWKVLSLLRKFSDGKRMSFPQRYRYNEMAQRYAIQSDLWRKKMRIREEGYRRPEEAVLSVQVARSSGERERRFPAVYGLARKTETAAADAASKAEAAAVGAKAAAVAAAAAPVGEPFSVQFSDADRERDKVVSLYQALTAAKQKSGEEVSGNFDSFSAFVRKKTTEIRKQHRCDAVVYSVELQDGHVKLKAKAKVKH